MGFFEIVLLALGLSMDAFAVSVCKGMALREQANLKNGAIAGAYFGVAQALMPLLGFLLGSQFARFIEPVDHWVVFALLAFIGVKMIVEAIKTGDSCPADSGAMSFKKMIGVALATSIDALAVGISLSFLDVNIVPAVLIIGATTFLLSALGVLLGGGVGQKLKGKAEIFGGAILILIGLKILLEHLGVL